jgi:hypothetical protein
MTLLLLELVPFLVEESDVVVDAEKASRSERRVSTRGQLNT